MSIKYESISTWILDCNYVFVVIRTYDKKLVSILVHKDLVNEKDQTVELEEKSVDNDNATLLTPTIPSIKFTTADKKEVFISPTDCLNGADLVVETNIVSEIDKIS